MNLIADAIDGRGHDRQGEYRQSARSIPGMAESPIAEDRQDAVFRDMKQFVAQPFQERREQALGMWLGGQRKDERGMSPIVDVKVIRPDLNGVR